MTEIANSVKEESQTPSSQGLTDCRIASRQNFVTQVIFNSRSALFWNIT